ncbi:MAG: osmoprotectant NAGGN system M42 family peptidase [Candidatus Competibacterales bacterium]
MRKPDIDLDYLSQTLLELLAIPSPVGLTDEVVHYTCRRLSELDVPFELTRRGAIRATLKGREPAPARALAAHLDTLGAVVRRLKDNGRLALLPLGTWSSRFAEGARVTLFTDRGAVRGNVLPLMASGHAFDTEVDSQPVSWDHVELRIDAPADCREDLIRLGVHVGDYVAFDPHPEINDNGYINARYLDDKAGVATLLAAIKALRDQNITLPVDCYPLFTISEEVGSGASAIIPEAISEMVGIDIAIPAQGQNSRERGVTIPLKDSHGPFDYHLSRKLIALCQDYGLEHQRDVFRYYYSDSASALNAGHDIRPALICFGADASHGYERTHISALQGVAELIALYAQSPPTYARDLRTLGPIEGFPHQIDHDNLQQPPKQLPNPPDFLDPWDSC